MFSNDDLPSLSDFAIPSSSKDDDFLPFDLFSDDTNHSNMLADGPYPSILDEFGDLDELQSQNVDKHLSDLLDFLAALPKNNSANDNSPPTKKNPNTSFVVKSSDINNTTNFINADGFFQIHKTLKMSVSPFLYQRTRYENELSKTLRYIFVPNDGSLTLQVPDLWSDFIPEVLFWMRITRKTIPYGVNNLTFSHPYPIWLNDERAKVHNGSLFIPVIDRTIKIEKLIMQRSRQDELNKIKQFAIFTSQELDFNNFHVINTSTAKRTIDEYKLRYSILHFQIFVVDQNNTAYPTDVECETEPIYEYEANELKDLPEDVRNLKKNAVKCKRIGQRKESKATKTEKCLKDKRA